MRLARLPHLDALCGEYLLGTLRGGARRRFEQVLRQDPLVAQRLAHWQRSFALRYRAHMNVAPKSQAWRRLERELQLDRYRTPWWLRATFWRGWAAAATAALVLAVAIQWRDRRVEAPQFLAIAQLASKDQPPSVSAALSADGRMLELRAARPIEAGPQQSYELWVIPAEGGAPLSLAVLGRLDATFVVPENHRARLRKGATLAVSVEPAGGSPTGGPTGPVILIGAIT